MSRGVYALEVKAVARSVQSFSLSSLPPFMSEGNDLDLFLNHIRKVHLFDEVNDLVEARVDKPSIVTHRADTDLRPLPEIIVTDLRDGHVEPVSDPIDHLPKDVTFFL